MVTVVRSLVGHCDVNPIELLWLQVKRFVASQNKGRCDSRRGRHLINHILSLE